MSKLFSSASAQDWLFRGLMPTPWGSHVKIRCVSPGFYEIRMLAAEPTIRGGYLLAENFARIRLSRAAMAKASRYATYLTYDFTSRTLELPSSWAIIPLELTQFRSLLLEDHAIRADPEQYLLRVLSAEAADYLIERGIEPHADLLASWRSRALAASMLRSRDGNLVTAASVETMAPGRSLVNVRTADGKTHQVTTQSYNTLDPMIPLLPACHRIRRPTKRKDPYVCASAK